jgi:hypothetical protein
LTKVLSPSSRSRRVLVPGMMGASGGRLR